MVVDLFIPCFIDQIYPRTAFNVVKILEKLGVEVNYNPEQTCCGQPSFNSGYRNETRTLALKFMNNFKEDRMIVSPSASCTSFIKNYYSNLFNKSEPEYEGYLRLNRNLYELTDFLVNKLGVIDLGASFPHTVTYHDACTALREYKLKDEPRVLLEKVKGLKIIEMEESKTCCGFGGTFSVKHCNISSAMTQQKVENALKTGAEYIVSTEASCLMNIEGYIQQNACPIKPIHIADILASGW